MALPAPDLDIVSPTHLTEDGYLEVPSEMAADAVLQHARARRCRGSHRPGCQRALIDAAEFLGQARGNGRLARGGTFALAAIAGLIALQAFGASTGSPRLEMQVRFPFSSPNRPAFKAHITDNQVLVQADEFKQLYGHILVRNLSGYSARNPAVVVRLNAMAILPSGWPCESWSTVEFVTTVGAIAIQWDGGPSYSIHGNSTRHIGLDLPKLSTTTASGRSPLLTFELLAEGYRKVVEIPVVFKLGDESLIPAGPVRQLPEWI